MKIVARYSDVYQAYIVRGRLESEGIICEITNDSSPYPGLGNIQGFDIRLVVNDEDYDRALSLISEAADSSAS